MDSANELSLGEYMYVIGEDGSLVYSAFMITENAEYDFEFDSSDSLDIIWEDIQDSLDYYYSDAILTTVDRYESGFQIDIYFADAEEYYYTLGTLEDYLSWTDYTMEDFFVDYDMVIYSTGESISGNDVYVTPEMKVLPIYSYGEIAHYMVPGEILFISGMSEYEYVDYDLVTFYDYPFGIIIYEEY